jgi:hypothetical protein
MTLTKNQKIAGISALGIIALYFIFKPSKYNGFENSGMSTDVNGNTVPNFNAREIATKLYDLMRTSWSMSNAESQQFMSLLTPLSNAQFNEVHKAFGKRTYNTVTKNQSFPLFYSPDFHDLRTWMKYELDPKLYQTLSNRFTIL